MVTEYLNPPSLNKLIGLKSEERMMTQEELLKWSLHQSSEQGVIDKDETEMLKDVFLASRINGPMN